MSQSPTSIDDDSAALLERYLDAVWMERGLSENTLTAYRRDLLNLAEFLQARQMNLSQAAASDINDMLAAMASRQCTPRSQARFVSTLRGFYRYLMRESVIEQDPSLHIESPKLGRPLPKTLTENDVERLLAAPHGDVPIEARDRAMLELLYATGLCVSELTGLTMTAIYLRQGMVRVTGKGGKERLVPMGETAQHCLQEYIANVRPDLLSSQPSDYLFPGRAGRAMTRQTFWHRVKCYAARIDLQKPLSPHVLRHCCEQQPRQRAIGRRQ